MSSPSSSNLSAESGVATHRGDPERILEAIDPAERRRMITEAAYERYMQRGYCDGFEVDDWLQAEAEVDDWIFNRSKARAPG
jgi:Protein of unknown function (DUF2934)